MLRLLTFNQQTDKLPGSPPSPCKQTTQAPVVHNT
nr:MAG TPA: hypothetical protein [Caudoviricetes sp.]